MAARGPSAARPARQGGAVLLILLTLIGLGAATLLINAMGHNNLQALRERRTMATLAQAREAVIGYATQHGRLPRPAASATDGLEMAAPCTTEESCSGFLPWVALGIEGSDSWGKRLRYAVTPVFTREPVDVGRAVATKVVRARDGDGKLYYLAGQETCSLRYQCLPFVVLSAGKDNFGTSDQGVALPNNSDSNDDEVANDKAVMSFISRPASDDANDDGGEFDDLMVWATWNNLMRRMKAAGRLP
jgi:type II secretory pathway pseudopilin PulG